MQIVCPNCKTSYQIADIAIGASGRAVRCVRCQHKWRAEPPAAPATEAEAVAAFRSELGKEPSAPTTEPPVAAEPAAEPPTAQSEPIALPVVSAPGDPAGTEATAEPAVVASVEATEPVALSDIPIPVENAPPLVPTADGDQPAANAEMDNGPPDIESVAARRARATARKRRSRWRVPLPVAIAVLAGLSAAALSFRKEIVRHAPQLASFYSAIGMPVNLRGLAFSDLKIGNEIHDGVPVLVIEGMIVSTVSQPVDVPRMRFALRSATGAEVYSWTAPPTQEVLGPFETMPFRTRLASPPAEGHDIQVRFFTRRDAVAGLR